MNSPEVALGYSLEALRDLEQKNLGPEARSGFFFDESLRMLFKRMNDGYQGPGQLDGLKSPLFDERATPRLSRVRLRNEILQKVIRLLCLTPEARRAAKRGRERISYAQLGINQLGAVYEGLLAYTGFFARHAVPVPAMFSSDSASKRALFEDLGDTSLYAYLKLPRDTAGIESIYRAVMQSLVTIHTSATDRVAECPLLKTRIFDYDYFRWETTYFLDRFVVGLRKLAIGDRPAVDAALHRLAQGVNAAVRSIIHRDFQCQNIMIHGGVPRIIDYQGARMAPPAYDVASILWDPYHHLDDAVRERLLGYYVGEMKAHRPAFDEKAFRQTLVGCRLQRHMQALGAYGFLAEVKGKKYFLKYVPEALALLRADIGEARQDYPELERLISSL